MPAGPRGTDILLIRVDFREGKGKWRPQRCILEKSDQCKEEDKWEGTKPDSGRQGVFPVAQAWPSALYHLFINSFPSHQKRWWRNYCYLHFPDEKAEAQRIYVTCPRSHSSKDAVSGEDWLASENREHATASGTGLLGTRAPPCEAGCRVPRALALGQQALGRLSCSAHSAPRVQTTDVSSRPPRL